METYSSQLSAEERNCYRQIVNNIESFKSEWIFQNVSFNTIGKIYQAVLNDHPEYFWLSGKCSGTTRILGTQSTLTFKPGIDEHIGQISGMRRVFDSTVDSLIKNAKRHSHYLHEQILYIHDYLVEHTDYKLNAPHCYDAYGCLILHKSVCAGYSAAFQVLMKKLGVECGRTSGWSSSKMTGNASHEWNYVKLDGTYYYNDVTWDDPIINGGCDNDNLSHDFFCVDYSEILLTHRFEQNQFIPKTNGRKLDYYTYQGWCLDRYSFEMVKTIAAKQLVRENKFFVKFSTKLELDRAKRDLLDMQRVFTIPGI